MEDTFEEAVGDGVGMTGFTFSAVAEFHLFEGTCEKRGEEVAPTLPPMRVPPAR